MSLAILKYSLFMDKYIVEYRSTIRYDACLQCYQLNVHILIGPIVLYVFAKLPELLNIAHF